jgi:SAM-dependent methyltransferase
MIRRRNIEDLSRKYYPVRIDRFSNCIERHVKPGDVIVDAGCGNGTQHRYDLKNRSRILIGIDSCEDLVRNQNVTTHVRGNLEAMPLSDGCVDVIISRFVLEHVRRPAKVFSEFARVLKRGGHLIFLTPNKFNYVYLVAAATPATFHAWINRIRTGGVMSDEDTFPTYYRLNFGGAIRRHARKAGLEIQELHFFEPPPAYLVFSLVLYRLGVLYERVVNAVPVLAFLRGLIVGVLTKA